MTEAFPRAGLTGSLKPSPAILANVQPTSGEHMREYHLYLLRKRKLTLSTVGLHISAVRFFFVKTLRRPYGREPSFKFHMFCKA